MEVRYPTGTVSHQFSSFSSLIRANPDASFLPPKCVATTLDSSLDIPYSCSTGTWQFRCFALVSWDESHNLVGSKIRVLESSSRLSLSSLSPLSPPPPQTAVRDFTGASNSPGFWIFVYVFDCRDRNGSSERMVELERSKERKRRADALSLPSPSHPPGHPSSYARYEQ